jgi:hypothetical protein
MTGSIPAPHLELAIADVILWDPTFIYFVGDDGGGADTLQDLIHFLEHHRYLIRLAWAKPGLNPINLDSAGCMSGSWGMYHGPRLSVDMVGTFRDWLILTEPGGQ